MARQCNSICRWYSDLHFFEFFKCAMHHILWILFICGTNTTHEGTTSHVLFSSQWVKGQGHMGRSNFCGRNGGVLLDYRSIISCWLLFDLRQTYSGVIIDCCLTRDSVILVLSAVAVWQAHSGVIIGYCLTCHSPILVFVISCCWLATILNLLVTGQGHMGHSNFCGRAGVSK